VSAAALGALRLLCAALGAATFLGCAVGSLAVGGSALLGLAVALCAAWFTAVGALASQVMDTRRRAAALSGALVVVAFGVRVAADGSHAGAALRWASPLGWAELSQPFEGGEWLPLALLAISAAAIAGIAVAFASRRDLGAGLAADSAARTPRLALLGSPAAYAARSSIASTAGWALALGAFGVLIGTLARDVAAFARTSAQLGRFGSRLGAGALVHPSAYVGLTYAFLVVPLAVQHVLSLGNATDDERRGRLDVVLAGAVSRPTWLMGTALVAATQVVVIALTLGVGIWAGGAARHAGLGFGAVIGGALNCLPAVALFGGVCVFATGFLPRVAVAFTMALLGASYVVQVIGASTRVPRWVLDASPFHHVAAMPGVGANWGGAVGLLVAGGVLALLGVAGFARRDVVTG
jgi:ABC-2 type transport system permease protein